MYEKKILGLKEALGAINAMMKEVEKGNYWKNGNFAIVDPWGVLIAFARMDGSGPLPVNNSIRKAYTAAMWARDTSDFLEFIKERPWDESTYGNDWTVCPGGVVITEPGFKPNSIARTPELNKLGLISEKGLQHNAPHILGAIGVGCVGPYNMDEQVARVGLRYIQSVLWPKKKHTA